MMLEDGSFCLSSCHTSISEGCDGSWPLVLCVYCSLKKIYSATTYVRVPRGSVHFPVRKNNNVYMSSLMMVNHLQSRGPRHGGSGSR
jgi:hypothetical protein